MLHHKHTLSLLAGLILAGVHTTCHAAVDVFLDDDTLCINGDDRGNDIEINIIKRPQSRVPNAPLWTFVEVVVREVDDEEIELRMTFHASAVGDIEVHAGKGGDEVYNNTSISSHLFGGSGRDFLYGGSSHDWLYGEEDPDTLYGRGGNDTLHAGISHITGAPSLGADNYLFGGSGVDIYTYNAFDFLYDDGTPDNVESYAGYGYTIYPLSHINSGADKGMSFVIQE